MTVSKSRALKIYHILRKQEELELALRTDRRHLRLLKKGPRNRPKRIASLSRSLQDRLKQRDRLLRQLVKFTIGEIQGVRNWYLILKALDRNKLH